MAANIRIPFTLPSSLPPNSNYTIQMSLHHVDRDTDIFIEHLLQPGDLAAGNSAQQKVVVLPSGSLPRFKHDGEVHMMAHFWKGGKLVETQDCGQI